jgi:hypothetical protein
MDSYSAEKLASVSNLNGTSFNEIIVQITSFPILYFLSLLIKVNFFANTTKLPFPKFDRSFIFRSYW